MRKTLQILTIGLSTFVAGCTYSGEQALSEVIIREELANRTLKEATKKREMGEAYYKEGITMRDEARDYILQYKKLANDLDRREADFKKRELALDHSALELIELRHKVRRSQQVYLQLNKDTIKSWKDVNKPEEILFDKTISAEDFQSYDTLMKRTIEFNNQEGDLIILPIIDSNNLVVGIYHSKAKGNLTPELKKQIMDRVLYGKK